MAHGLVVWQIVVLRQHPDADAAAERHAPGIRFEASGEHLHEGRFAVAVAPDDADAVTAVDADGDVVEHDFRGELDVQMLAAEEMGHPSSLGGGAWLHRSVPEPRAGC